MTYSVKHALQGTERPFWYHLENYSDREKAQALHRARNYALDHGGYVCVRDETGKTIYGTDPVGLDHAIVMGINHDFVAPALAAS